MKKYNHNYSIPVPPADNSGSVYNEGKSYTWPHCRKVAYYRQNHIVVGVSGINMKTEKTATKMITI